MKKIMILLILIALATSTNAIFTYNGRFVIQDESEDVHRVTLGDLRAPYSGTWIESESLHASRRNRVNIINLYGRFATESYELTNSDVNSQLTCGTNRCTNCQITKELTSANGILDGVDHDSGLVTVRYRAYFVEGAPGVPTVTMHQQFYHVDSNTETALLYQLNKRISNFETTYQDTFALSHSWGIGDRLKNVISFTFDCGGGGGGEGGAAEGEEFDIMVDTVYSNYERIIDFAYKKIQDFLGVFRI